MRPPMTISSPALQLLPVPVVLNHGFFTLGGLLARYWRPAYRLLPWALTSAMLSVAGMWDNWQRGGPIDFVIVGLAAYELMIGLLEERDPMPVPRAAIAATPLRVSKSARDTGAR